MTNPKKDLQHPDFEVALKSLETIVSQMEKGELNLEQALKQFEEGVALARLCQNALAQAELRVQELTAEDNPPSESISTN